MSDDETKGIHLYGATDDASRTPVPPQGMRGEGADPEALPPHRVLAAGGQAIEVAETNGVTAVEAAGGPGRANDD